MASEKQHPLQKHFSEDHLNQFLKVVGQDTLLAQPIAERYNALRSLMQTHGPSLGFPEFAQITNTSDITRHCENLSKRILLLGSSQLQSTYLSAYDNPLSGLKTPKSALIPPGLLIHQSVSEEAVAYAKCTIDFENTTSLKPNDNAAPEAHDFYNVFVKPHETFLVPHLTAKLKKEWSALKEPHRSALARQLSHTIVTHVLLTTPSEANYGTLIQHTYFSSEIDAYIKLLKEANKKSKDFASITPLVCPFSYCQSQEKYTANVNRFISNSIFSSNHPALEYALTRAIYNFYNVGHVNLTMSNSAPLWPCYTTAHIGYFAHCLHKGPDKEYTPSAYTPLLEAQTAGTLTQIPFPLSSSLSSHGSITLQTPQRSPSPSRSSSSSESSEQRTSTKRGVLTRTVAQSSLPPVIHNGGNKEQTSPELQPEPTPSPTPEETAQLQTLQNRQRANTSSPTGTPPAIPKKPAKFQSPSNGGSPKGSFKLADQVRKTSSTPPQTPLPQIPVNNSSSSQDLLTGNDQVVKASSTPPQTPLPQIPVNNGNNPTPIASAKKAPPVNNGGYGTSPTAPKKFAVAPKKIAPKKMSVPTPTGTNGYASHIEGQKTQGDSSQSLS